MIDRVFDALSRISQIIDFGSEKIVGAVVARMYRGFHSERPGHAVEFDQQVVVVRTKRSPDARRVRN
jgi:hypothetical protein